MFPGDLKQGNHYSVFEPEAETWFDVEVERMSGKSETIRSKMEQNYVKTSQQNEEEQRPFAIDATWVTAWQEYHRTFDTNNRSNNPGPIENRKIAKSLLSLRSLKEDTGAYFVSKNTFYFFHTLYGGGPVVVENAYFNVEVRDKQLLTSGVSNKFDDHSSNASSTPRKLNSQVKPTT